MNVLLVPVPGALQRKDLVTLAAYQHLALLMNASDVVLQIELVFEAAAAILASVADVQVLHFDVSGEAVLSAEDLGAILALEGLSLVVTSLACQPFRT